MKTCTQRRCERCGMRTLIQAVFSQNRRKCLNTLKVLSSLSHANSNCYIYRIASQGSFDPDLHKHLAAASQPTKCTCTLSSRIRFTPRHDKLCSVFSRKDQGHPNTATSRPTIQNICPQLDERNSTPTTHYTKHSKPNPRTPRNNDNPSPGPGRRQALDNLPRPPLDRTRAPRLPHRIRPLAPKSHKEQQKPTPDARCPRPTQLPADQQ